MDVSAQCSCGGVLCEDFTNNLTEKCFSLVLAGDEWSNLLLVRLRRLGFDASEMARVLTLAIELKSLR